MNLRRGEVVIALFPNADGSPPKPRPVLVVQADAYNARLKNTIVAAITTNLAHAKDAASVLLDISTVEGRSSGLRQNSLISCINLATMHEGLIAKTVGRLPASLMLQVDDCLRAALGLH